MIPWVPAAVSRNSARAFAPPDVYLAHAEALLAPGGQALVFLNDGAWSPPPGWQILGETPYTIDGKPRRMVRVGR